ncbi:MAG: homogentisate phytyltransferase [Leptolyngbyaceae cyanobacterium RU_5_1]|nr:homogentisate phytyltransferase [Leptolyngbyaceae cyanobacterium RU_5_1]
MSRIVSSKIGHPLSRWLYAFWKFSRPHTIIGTCCSVIGLAILALAYTSIELPFQLSDRGAIDQPGLAWAAYGFGIVSALFPSLCANVYIVGLNQLEDVAIDRINKPSLPLASGEFAIAEGRMIVAVTGILALVLAGLQGSFLFFTVLSSMVIGTAYSLPPIRLKRFPVWAAFCIFGVRGLIVNLGFFQHFQHCLSDSGIIPLEVWALTIFIILFAFAIAISKDIPDTEGDRRFKIQTLTIRFGTRAVLHLTRLVLTFCYAMLIGITGLGILSVQPVFLIATHLGLLGLLWIRSFRVDLQNKRQISQFYQFIWQLFFLEYLLFPIAVVLRVVTE